MRSDIRRIAPCWAVVLIVDQIALPCVDEKNQTVIDIPIWRVPDSLVSIYHRKVKLNILTRIDEESCAESQISGDSVRPASLDVALCLQRRAPERCEHAVDHNELPLINRQSWHSDGSKQCACCSRGTESSTPAVLCTSSRGSFFLHWRLPTTKSVQCPWVLAG